VHGRIGQTNNYRSFTVIRRRISHSHSILVRFNAPAMTTAALARGKDAQNGNPSRVGIQPLVRVIFGGIGDAWTTGATGSLHAIALIQFPATWVGLESVWN
jgi:hypothetical protein